MALDPLSIKTVEEESLSKVFHDPIHGSIELPAICVAIIDTPEFQRLRYIKQLGLTFLVYPTAIHTRFDHSIGVCHLADEMVQALKRRHGPRDSHPIDIKEEEHLCVMIAGLCRDLGFGPFSHLFDQRFMRNKGKDYTPGAKSEKIFGEICKKPRIKKLLQKYNLDKEIKFIQELINPPPGLWEKDSTRTTYKAPWFCEGRGQDKSFLYLIVKNTLNGIDVAKWDYCARDCYFLGIPNSFDHQRLLKYARVLQWGERSEICFKFKEAFHLYNMYRMRHVLHMRAYQHSAKNAIEIMFSEALEEVEKSLTARKDTDLKMLFGEGNLSDKVDNVEDFLSLTDDIYRRILLCPHPDIASARAILQEIEERQLYKLVVEATYSDKVKEDEIVQSAWKALGNLDSSKKMACIETVYFDYGVNREEPLRNVQFFTKTEPNHPFFLREEQEPRVLPKNMLERKIRVYCKSTEASCRDEIHGCLMKWWTDQYQAGTILSTPPNVKCPTTPASGRKTSSGSFPKPDPQTQNPAKRDLTKALEDEPSTSQQSMTRRSERLAKKMKTEEEWLPPEPTQDRTALQEKALNKAFDVVVENARDDWKEIARRLQFSSTDINATEKEKLGDCTECMRTIQHLWKKREGKSATIHRLMAALEAARHKDVMEKVSEIADAYLKE